MIAVKWKTGLSFLWPERTKSPVGSLPAGYDVIMTNVDYSAHIDANLVNYQAYQAEQAQIALSSSMASKFRSVREKWQQMADDYAASNVGASISTAQAKTLADGFAQVVYYLSTNVPMQAIAEIELVPIVDPFFSLEKRNAMKNELLNFVIETFNIS